jgi:hypothetical protein
MGAPSTHLSTWIARPAAEVYDFLSDPANVPAWAAGLGTSIEEVDGQWIAQSPMGRIVVAFTPRNDLGVVDHTVTLPSGEAFDNPMRVIPDGDGCEVVFTLRRQPDMTDEDFARDAAAVAADLATLKGLLERRGDERGRAGA